jgi:hypothetical protein
MTENKLYLKILVRSPNVFNILERDDAMKLRRCALGEGGHLR